MSHRRDRDWPQDEQALRAAPPHASGGQPATHAVVRQTSQTPSGTLDAAKRIGRHYVVERVIGQGGMGHVVKAVHDLTGQVVAIKTLSPHLAEDPGLRQRFIQEARTLAAFDHPNLIPLYTFLEENGQFFLVMQFIDGQDLDSMFRGTRGLDLSFSVSVFYQTLDGLAYAHRHGVVHRDIKPANILVMQDGRVKLTDFGIARISGGNRLTKAGVPVGTVFYMAPEQVQGAEAEPRADLYAAGVSLFEVLTGRLPFEGDDYAVRKGHVESPAPDPRIYRPDIPPELVNIIQKAMAKRPEDRFQTAEAFRDALRIDRGEYGIPRRPALGQRGAPDDTRSACRDDPRRTSPPDSCCRAVRATFCCSRQAKPPAPIPVAESRKRPENPPFQAASGSVNRTHWTARDGGSSCSSCGFARVRVLSSGPKNSHPRAATATPNHPYSTAELDCAFRQKQPPPPKPTPLLRLFCPKLRCFCLRRLCARPMQPLPLVSLRVTEPR